MSKIGRIIFSAIAVIGSATIITNIVRSVKRRRLAEVPDYKEWIDMPEHTPGIYEKYIKRILDVACALAAFAVFGWLYLIIAVLVKIKLGSPILFLQKRAGYHTEVFNIYKFRSMTNERDENGNLLPDEKRVTAFGRFLRKTSLDEIPEAINILKGDMSVIGPRPLPLNHLGYYTEYENHRHDVMPGLSGLAQLHGASCKWEERFEYDIEYARNISFRNDLKILLQTVIYAFKRSDDVARKADGSNDFDKYRLAEWEAEANQTK